uniref:E3 ubiquitin-protein ligase TRIM39-like n=1 Tax=Cyprinus carpio TaxID=7962 RepID=A0A8C1M844_CYPCA
MPFSRSFLSEEQLLCSICLDVFDNPVSTPCGHNFCVTCIGHYWDSVKHCQCPLCKQTFKRKPDLHINRTLREITEQFKHMKGNLGTSGGDEADRDAEKGGTTQEPVGSTLRPGQLPGYLLEEMKQRLTRHRAHKHEVQRSMQLFGALISSLERSQAGLLEVTEINRRSAEHQAELMITELEQEITELRRRNWTGISLTCDLGTKTIYTSVCQLLEQFKEELQKAPAFLDVTLDTNTAHPRLILSEDKKKVWCGERHQQVPNNRERFDRVVCVLGCEGFTSGRHYWEVEVDGKTDWDLGVASHSCNRKGKITVSPSNGNWFLSLRDKNNYAFRTEPSTALPLSMRPQKIGLFVDYEKGQVSFYNVDAKMHIYTFMDNFSETIYPFFSPCTNKTGKNYAPLVISPVLMD